MRSNASEVIRQLEKYKKKVEGNTTDLVKTLVNEGQKNANNKLTDAEYAGDMQSRIVAEANGKKGEISLAGADAGFIEFGTGSTFVGGEYSHPLAGSIPDTTRGSYGKHHGLLPQWQYKGEVGNAPETYPIRYKDENGNMFDTGYVTTRGNRANRVVYDTGKGLEQIALDKAKEVFGND